MGAEKGNIRGYLLISVEEASGRNKHDTFVWDNNSFEGFVKAELRGGDKPIKAQTSKVSVQGTSCTWKEDLKLEVLERSNELRLMLCRDKTTFGMQQRAGVQVLAACGIYVNDILAACPIDKYFELFKPTQGGEGGYIRVRLDFSESDNISSSTQPSEDSKMASNRANLSFQGYTAEDEARLPTVPEEARGKGGFLKRIAMVGVVAAGMIVGANKIMK